jgi:F420-dependent oxidoreductase-like protein
MRFDIDVAQHQLSWPQLLDRVRWSESAGFTAAWVFDHFQALYGDATGPCLEGWTLLAALGAATERIRLGTLVTGITYRHPSILATQVVTVDHVSDGRVECAIGAAWYVPEHRQLGIDFPSDGERISRLEETAQVLRLLMTTDDASFDGRFYQLDHATYRPRPVQQPHPPIWIGGSGNRLLRIAGRYADAWHGLGDPAEFTRKTRLLDAAADAAGRDPASIPRAASLSLSEPWDDVRRTIDTLAEAGADCLIVGWPGEGRGRLEEFVEDLLPDYGG